MCPARETLNKSDFLLFVIPAQAGIQQFQRVFWMPACAGMTAKGLNQSFPSLIASPELDVVSIAHSPGTHYTQGEKRTGARGRSQTLLRKPHARLSHPSGAVPATPDAPA
jgi:hypothetical protein